MDERPELILFDFDGVIADTFHIAHGVAKKLCVMLTEHEYRKRFEGNIYEATKAFFADDHGDECDHDLDWWAHFTPGFNTHARPFDGMLEAVRTLAKHRRIFIVSSCRDSLIETFLEKYELKHCITGVYGADVSPKKSEKFETICASYGTEPSRCIFATDTLGDVNEASGVGIPSIGVTWGFQDRETLLRGSPYAIVDTPEELLASIERYFSLK